MNLDLTKVLGSAVLLGAAIASAIEGALPMEVNLTLVSIAGALWVVPPVLNEFKAFMKAMK